MKSRILPTVAAACVGSISVITAHDARSAPAGGSFFEDFTSLAHDRWYLSDGWDNGPHQNCTWSRRNVKVENGTAYLTLSDQPYKNREFSCAELQTRRFYSYGTYEVRMKPAAGSGLNSAFFSYTGPSHGNRHDEIDFEFLGKNSKSVYINYHVNYQQSTDGKKHEKYLSLPFDATESMNDYAFQWTPDALRWFVNGELVREVKRSETPLPETPQKIYLSIWNARNKSTEAWMGRWSYPGKPFVASIDYIAFTAPGDKCQFPKSVVCKFNPQ